MPLKVAPPCATVVPPPLSVPAVKVEAPVTVSVPLPVSVPPDCARLTMFAVLLPISNVPPSSFNGPSPAKFVTVKLPPVMSSVAFAADVRLLSVTAAELVTV